MRVVEYLKQVFAASDLKELLEQVSQKMLMYTEAHTFLRQVRGMGMNGSEAEVF
jgi:hypothetical protein